MTGVTNGTVVALGGRLKYLRDSDDIKGYKSAAKGARRVMTEREVTAAISDKRLGEEDDFPPKLEVSRLEWQDDVVLTHQRFSLHRRNFPLTNFEVLALREDRAEAGTVADFLNEPKAVLIGKPLWISEGTSPQAE
jgi:hypothetical protein